MESFLHSRSSFRTSAGRLHKRQSRLFQHPKFCSLQLLSSVLPEREQQTGCHPLFRRDYYVQQYLDSEDIPVHYLSSGDYYLVIPRYSGMELSLYKNDLETSERTLFYHDPDCEPFIIQCNVSDIFSDATIQLTYQGDTVEFSPFISLKDGSLEIGEHGLNLTRTGSGSQSGN